MYKHIYIGILTDRIPCVDSSVLVFLLWLTNCMSCQLRYSLRKPRNSQRRLFSLFVQISRQFGGIWRGFSLAISAHLADVEVQSLFVISIRWGKFALKIAEENKLACITSQVGCYIFRQMHSSPRSNTWSVIPHQLKLKLHCLHLFQIQLKTASGSACDFFPSF